MSIEGPAGFQYSEQDPDTPWVTHGAGLAETNDNVGNPRPLDRGPGRLVSENAIEKMINNFTVETVRSVKGKHSFQS